jgi:uncharacterized membrane protein YphA (DoxX/SURF4 family)
LLDLALMGRFTLALVLIVAGAGKLARGGRAELVTALANYAILPNGWIRATAITLPWLELVTGVLLGFGVLLIPAALCATAMLMLFAASVGWHTHRGRQFNCGCGGGGTISWSLAIRDLALGSIAAMVAIYPHAALVVWVGPGWIRATPGSVLSVIPVPMTVLLLGAGLRLIRVGSPLIWQPMTRRGSHVIN